jgi:hypothetical protein
MGKEDENHRNSIPPPWQYPSLVQFRHDESTQAERERDTVGLVYKKFETVFRRDQNKERRDAEYTHDWPRHMGKNITGHKAHCSQTAEYQQAILDEEINKRMLKGKREEGHEHAQAVLFPVEGRPPVETHQYREQ